MNSIKNFWRYRLGLPVSVEGVKGLLGISLYRNAVYLILNHVILAITGFFFWIAAAHLYPTAVVGLASSVIAATGLLTLFSNLGIDFGLIRFLPAAGEKTRELLNTCFTIGGAAAILAAGVFLAGLDFWSPALLPLREKPLFILAFLLFNFANTLQGFHIQSFTAARKSVLAMVQGWISGLLRFVPLLLLAAVIPDYGIFFSWGIAITVAVVVAIFFLMPRAYPCYRPLPAVKFGVIGPMLRFSFANYAGNLLWMLPQLVLPILVINLLGAEQNAFFYIGWSVACVVFMIPTATTFSLLAEASHDEKSLQQQLRRSSKLILLLLLPAMLILMILGGFVLSLFGQMYADNSLELLRLLVIAALPLSINHVFFTIRRVEKKMASVVLLTGFMATATLGLSYMLMPKVGVIGAGIAWLISQSLGALISLPYLWRLYFRKEPN